MKLSVFTVATPDLQPEELAKAAADAGIEGIEWRFKEIPEEVAGEKPSFWRHNRRPWIRTARRRIGSSFSKRPTSMAGAVLRSFLI